MQQKLLWNIKWDVNHLTKGIFDILYQKFNKDSLIKLKTSDLEKHILSYALLFSDRFTVQLKHMQDFFKGKEHEISSF